MKNKLFSYLKTVAYFLLKKGFKLADGISYGIFPIPLKSIFWLLNPNTFHLDCLFQTDQLNVLFTNIK